MDRITRQVGGWIGLEKPTESFIMDVDQKNRVHIDTAQATILVVIVRYLG